MFRADLDIFYETVNLKTLIFERCSVANSKGVKYLPEDWKIYDSLNTLSISGPMKLFYNSVKFDKFTSLTNVCINGRTAPQESLLQLFNNENVQNKLEKLELKSGVELTAEIINSMKKLKKIKCLIISHRQFCDISSLFIENKYLQESLNILNIEYVPLSVSDLVSLSELKNIKQLELKDNGLNNGFTAHMEGLRDKLIYLSLERNDANCLDLYNLKKFKYLKRLRLSLLDSSFTRVELFSIFAPPEQYGIGNHPNVDYLSDDGILISY
jgi:hypothetical protein